MTTDKALRDCPCCHSPADVTASTGEDAGVIITCSKHGCILVKAKTLSEAEAIWQERTFRDHEFPQRHD